MPLIIVLNPWKNDEVDRDLESALPSGLLPHSTPATLYWLRNNYEIVEGVCIPRYIIYDHYKDFCRKYRIAPVNAASFGKVRVKVLVHMFDILLEYILILLFCKDNTNVCILNN